MYIVICPKCDELVGAEIPECPKCGTALDGAKQVRRREDLSWAVRWLIIGLAALIVSVGFYAYFNPPMPSLGRRLSGTWQLETSELAPELVGTRVTFDRSGEFQMSLPLTDPIELSGIWQAESEGGEDQIRLIVTKSSDESLVPLETQTFSTIIELTDTQMLVEEIDAGRELYVRVDN